MLDKNPETRITIPQIKVSGEETPELIFILIFHRCFSQQQPP
jgi:hypothetical protein